MTTRMLTYFLFLALLAVFFVPSNTLALAQPGDFQVSGASAVTKIPHQIDLKTTQTPEGQTSEISDFVIDPEDVIQVKQGENLIVSTSEDLKRHQVSVRNIQGQQVNLVPLPTGIWSLQGLIPGIYTLDVIVDMSSSGISGTYETILVILGPNQQPLPPTTVINRITIQPPKSPQPCPANSNLVNGTCVKPSPGPGENDTEPIDCTMEISYGQGPCDEHYIPPNEDGQCPDGHRFVDERTGCVPEYEFGSPPPCTDETPPNTICRDEADPNTCEEGFVDKGNGCVPIEESEDRLVRPGCSHEWLMKHPTECNVQAESRGDNDNSNEEKEVENSEPRDDETEEEEENTEDESNVGEEEEDPLYG
jgi:hypothetical protein